MKENKEDEEYQTYLVNNAIYFNGIHSTLAVIMSVGSLFLYWVGRGWYFLLTFIFGAYLYYSYVVDNNKLRARLSVGEGNESEG